MAHLIILIAIALTCFTVAAQNTVYVVQEQRAQYKRDEYLLELLTKALDQSQYPAKLESILVHPHQQRTLLGLNSTQADIYWSMTSPEREQLAIAIKVPLFKGLIGKRALLTNKDYLPMFASIKEKSELAEHVAIQGHDWPDTKILAQNGLQVRPFANYQVMFSLTASGRVDYFPRSFIEVNSELSDLKDDKLVIVPNLFISYPTAFYYFVSSSKPKLAEAIYKGLLALKESGEFDRLFEHYFAEELASLPYQKSEVVEIKLDNPYFQN